MRGYAYHPKIMLKIMKQQKGKKLGCMSKILVPRHNSITRAKHDKDLKKEILMIIRRVALWGGKKETIWHIQTNHMYPHTTTE